jgi:hypothetical protein
LSNGAAAVVDAELMSEVDDAGEPVVVVGLSLIGAAVIEGADLNVGARRYPLMWKAQTSCTIVVAVDQESAPTFCLI